MNQTSPALAAETSKAEPPIAVIWNGLPFLVTGTIRRSQRIVRTKVVSAELRRQYNLTGWPRHLVLMREYHLLLPGDEIDLDVATNADEAEDELPDRIETLTRDIGTYREGKVTWRARSVTSFVSASLRASICTSMDNVPFIPSPLPAQPVISPAHYKVLQSAMKSGVVLRNSQMAEVLDPDERLLVNLLIAEQGEDPPRPLPLAQIARLMNVSDETVRRRRDELFAKTPALKLFIARYRARNAKGGNPDAIGGGAGDDEDEGGEGEAS